MREAVHRHFRLPGSRRQRRPAPQASPGAVWPSPQQRPILVTSNLILAETISLIGSRLYPKKAVEFGERLHRSRVIRLVYLNQKIEALALKTYEKFNNPKLSFADCTSFELIRLLRLDAVFAFDEHFARAGFASFGDGTSG